jgi:hypothetical protein
MEGYHYLLRLAHLINTLARFSKELAGLFSSARSAGGDRLYLQHPQRPLAKPPRDRAAAEPPLAIALALTSAHPRLLPLAAQVAPPFSVAFLKRQ